MLNDMCRIDEVVLQNAKFTQFYPTFPNISALLTTANNKCNTEPTFCNTIRWFTMKYIAPSPNMFKK